MLDVWRVSRIASDDILEGDAATSARSTVAETVRKTVSPFRQFSRRYIVVFVYISFICKSKDKVLVRPDKNVNRRMLIFIEATRSLLFSRRKSLVSGMLRFFSRERNFVKGRGERVGTNVKE